MPISQLGVSFLPGADPGSGMKTANSPGTRNPVQEAIQVLSLRLPKVFGARALAPAPLLTGPGGLGQPAAKGNVSAQALAGLAGLPPSMAPPSMPAPMLPPLTLPPRPADDTPRMPTFAPSPAPDTSSDDDAPYEAPRSGGGPTVFGAPSPQPPPVVHPPTYTPPPASTPPPRVTPGDGSPPVEIQPLPGPSPEPPVYEPPPVFTPSPSPPDVQSLLDLYDSVFGGHRYHYF